MANDLMTHRQYHLTIINCLLYRDMKLLSPAISRLARLRLWRIDNWVSNPIAAQREVLQHLITSAQYTEFGRKHTFEKTIFHKRIQKKMFLFVSTMILNLTSFV